MISDDDPPIKTGPASQAYRDNWERIFGTDEEPKAQEQGQGYYVCVRCGKKSHPLDGPNHYCP